MKSERLGDPEGRRLAQREKGLLGDACRLVEAARVLIGRTRVDPASFDAALAQLREEERNAILRADGRIESRRRFKGASGNPILEGRPRMCLHIDESGTSVPFAAGQPEGHSVFALGAVALTDAEGEVYCSRADEIKNRFFGHTDITFHEPLMRKARDEFYFNGDKGQQAAFQDALRELLELTPFTAFGTVIRKEGFREDFVDTGIDPYLSTDVYSVAITMTVERFVDYLAHLPARYTGKIIFESQGPRQDAEHQHSYATLLIEGTQWVPEGTFANWLTTGCDFVPKSGSHPVEIADIVSRDLHEWVRSGCKEEPVYWDILKKKVYCRGWGLQGSFGFKVFPDRDLSECVMSHRKECGAAIPEAQKTEGA